MIAIFVTLTLISCSNAYIVPHIVTYEEETYIFYDTEYIVVNHRSVWLEAKYICENYTKGNLAIVNTNEVAAFLGQVLSETDLKVEDLWIGAKRKNNLSNFVWINKVGILTPDFIHKRSKDASHNIQDLECDLLRPFICEKPVTIQTNRDYLTIADWVTMGSYKYGTFYDKKTWRGAVTSCRKKNAHLAWFGNMDEVQLVSKYMLIGRPSLETAWIGGQYTEGEWMFLNGQLLPDKTNETTGYPPWAHNKAPSAMGCLAMDRHLADGATFTDNGCDLLLSYVCRKGVHDNPEYSVVVTRHTGYVIYYRPHSWQDARKQCQTHDAELTTFNSESIHDILRIMGEYGKEVNSAWVGGRLHETGEYFYWVKNNETVPDSMSKYPPWATILYDFKFQCLNLDRENHNFPLMYGVQCDIKQEFICEQSNLGKLPKPYDEEIGMAPMKHIPQKR